MPVGHNLSVPIHHNHNYESIGLMNGYGIRTAGGFR